jgi:hypothetical protein
MEKRFLAKNQFVDISNSIERVLFNQQWNSMVDDVKKVFPHPALQPLFDKMRNGAAE